MNEDNQLLAKPLIEAIEKNPQNPQPYLKLSELFWKARNVEIAKEILKLVLEFDTQNETAKRKLEWIEGFGVRPNATSVKLEDEKWEKQATLIARAITIALAAIGILLVVLVAKWILFKSAYKLAKGEDNFAAAKFSPDGMSLAFTQIPYFSPFDIGDISGWPKNAQVIISDVKGENKKVIKEIPVYPLERSKYEWLTKNRLAIKPTLKEDNDSITAVDVKSGYKNIIATGGDIWASPDGKYFCYLLTTRPGLFVDKDLILVDEHGAENTIASGYIYEVALSDQARLIAYTKLERPQSEMNEEEQRESEGEEPLFSETAFAFSFDVGQTIQISKKPQQVSSLVVSNDGKKIAFIDSSRERQLIVSDLQGNQTVVFTISNNFPWVENPTFSPDGRYLVFEAAMAKSTEARQQLTIKLPQVEKRLKAMKHLAPGFSRWSVVSDLFYVDLTQAKLQLKRLEIGNHRFKHNPTFDPSGKLIAFEQTTIDFKTETWIAKFNP